jgi:ATP-dependent Zn protease
VTSGLSSLGVIHEEALSGEVLYQTVQEIIRDSTELVEELIAEHKEALLALANMLLEQETLAGEQVRALVA